MCVVGLSNKITTNVLKSELFTTPPVSKDNQKFHRLYETPTPMYGENLGWLPTVTP